jgi:predicted RNA-binding protein with TRAM domain
MPRRFPEKTYIGTQKDKTNGVTRTKDFLTFVSQTKARGHLKVKILQVRRKFAIAEKLNEAGEEKNN